MPVSVVEVDLQLHEHNKGGSQFRMEVTREWLMRH
jgi:hypothetical protein